MNFFYKLLGRGKCFVSFHRFITAEYYFLRVLNPSACTSKQCKTTPINRIHIMLLINATETATRFTSTVSCEVSDENACRRELLTWELMSVAQNKDRFIALYCNEHYVYAAETK